MVRNGRLLKSKYGKPTKARQLDARLGAVLAGTVVPAVTWEMRQLRVELTLGAEQWSSGTRLRAFVYYQDPAAVARLRKVQDKSERTKL